MNDEKETQKEKLEARQKEFDEKFEKQPESVQKDVLLFQYKANKSQENLKKKMVFGKQIPNNILDDIKGYYENMTAALKLIGIDPETWND